MRKHHPTQSPCLPLSDGLIAAACWFGFLSPWWAFAIAMLAGHR